MSEHMHTHVDEHGNVIEHCHEHHHHDVNDITDYNEAVNAYRKTFPNKQRVIEETPDPAVKAMLLRMEQLGIDNSFDRFDKQQPQCNFGLAGICCRICHMGPCRITKKSPRGVCGADADLIVARNLLRAVAAGTAQHGMHAREVILSLKWAAEGKLPLPIVGEEKMIATAAAWGIPTEGRTVNEIAIDFANVLLADLSRPEADEEYQTIKYGAPPERQKVWKDLDIMPISTYHEVFESMHNSGEATDGDWRNIMKQFLRTGLTFVFGTVVDTNLATDSLFGVGERRRTMVNIGALKKNSVNIAVHGHMPTLVSEIVRLGQSEEYVEKAKAVGADGIQFYGICCTGLSATYRYNNVIPLCNPPGAELVLSTGALDLWVADVQDIYPSIMNAANCFKTTVVTTEDSTKLPGAEHIAYDHTHSNIGETTAIARKIVERAIESYQARKGIPKFIPPYEVEAELGFSVESVTKDLGGSFQPLADALKSGQIRGIINLVGCTNPKTVYERCIVDVADILLKNNILILTNGCASFPMLKLGYCNMEAVETKCGDSLKAFLKQYNMPPVWHVGECVDNTRSTGILVGAASLLGKALHEMPYAQSSPEWANEKGVGAALAFRLLGLNSYHCVEPQTFGSENVTRFLKEETGKMGLGVMVVNTDPKALGERIVSDLEAKRKALGWD